MVPSASEGVSLALLLQYTTYPGYFAYTGLSLAALEGRTADTKGEHLARKDAEVDNNNE